MDRRTFLKSIGIGAAAVAATPHVVASALEETVQQEGNPLGLPPAYEYSHEDLQKYRGWIKATMDHSKDERTPAIIIDKSTYTLHLIEDGKPTKAYAIELGFDPVHDKRKEGDGATPEGTYHVQRKLDRGETSFYRALLINYPDKQDWQEFKALKEAGELDQSDTIGGAIEIHGKGTGIRPNAGGQNWTLGCVALDNRSMDEVYASIEQGTPITIVKYGSTYPNYLDGTPHISKFRL